MKKIFSASLAITMACFLFMSCQKSGIETAQKPTNQLSEEKKIAVSKVLETYFSEKSQTSTRAARRAEFLVPYFSNENQGVIQFNPATMTILWASFTAELGTGDFFRKNPDGTYSVHVSSNSALADYSEIDLSNFTTITNLYGSPARLTADYTGKLVEIPITDDDGNILFVFRFIDFEESGRAVSVHGNGNVGVDGAGPWKKLAIKAVVTPDGQFQSEFTLK